MVTIALLKFIYAYVHKELIRDHFVAPATLRRAAIS